MTQAVATVDAPVDSRVWVTLSEAAAMQVPPVSRQAISKRVKSLLSDGRLATKPGPRGTVLINIVAFNRAVAAETDPAQALRNGKASSPAPVADDDGDDEPSGQTTGGASYHTSRAAREAYQAENARLDLAERTGQIVDRDDVERRTMSAFRRLRDRLLSMPSKVSERVAAAPDARSVKTILQTELRKVLDGLANELDHLADEDDDDRHDVDTGFDDDGEQPANPE